jgi:DNA-binding transcriptional MocR family regulator
LQWKRIAINKQKRIDQKANMSFETIVFVQLTAISMLECDKRLFQRSKIASLLDQENAIASIMNKTKNARLNAAGGWGDLLPIPGLASALKNIIVDPTKFHRATRYSETGGLDQLRDLIANKFDFSRNIDNEISNYLENARCTYRNASILAKTVLSKRIPNFKIMNSDGGFYLMARIPEEYLGNDVQFCETLYNSERMLVVPGSAFGETTRGWIRTAFAPHVRNPGRLTTVYQILARHLDRCGTDSNNIRQL